jgi:NAD-dependent dihydropyrimidine dehydrogenase PreA subunit
MRPPGNGMGSDSPLRTVSLFVLLVGLVLGLSALFDGIWGGIPQTAPVPKALILEMGMTVGQFGGANEIPNSALKEMFGLQAKSDLDRKMRDFGTAEQVASLVRKKMALAAESAGKNWLKIPLKFALWGIFLAAVFLLLRSRRAVSRLRKYLLLASVLVFGVGMGSDPSPMGTVKDAVHLYASARAVFLPRLIALAVFLAVVFLANKYICAWGCQLGTLQDLIFHINRTNRHKAILGRQVKLPFALTNSVRILFFCGFTLAAFLLAFDIIGWIDPFKVFKPAALGLYGGVFLALLLAASLFIYRPWCHLFCPFGLAGWLVEKVSRIKIKVNYETCIACRKCAAACPSTVMDAILRRDRKTIPDCFACYACREECPTGSIHFAAGRRALPPGGFFAKDPLGEAGKHPASGRGDRSLDMRAGGQ